MHRIFQQAMHSFEAVRKLQRKFPQMTPMNVSDDFTWPRGEGTRHAYTAAVALGKVKKTKFRDIERCARTRLSENSRCSGITLRAEGSTGHPS